jgi:PKD repeat protein
MKPLNKVFTLISLITLIGINGIDAQNIIWSEDFTGGIPVGWSTVDNTGNNFNWVLNNQDLDNSSSTPPGYTNTSAIASNSGGNHMLLWIGEYNRIAGQTYTNLDSYFQTSAISVNNLPSVSVHFQQKFKIFSINPLLAEAVLSVSTDPTFASNVQEYDIINGVDQNDESPDPMDMNINISSIAANYVGDIYLRFHVKNGISHYYWMIDDISVVETELNNIITSYGHYDFNGLQYTQIPSNHLSAINFSIVSENKGAADQIGTSLTLDVNDGTSSVFNLSTQDTTIPSLSLDTFKIQAAWTPPASPLNTSYTFTLSVTSDSTDYTPTDNSIVFPPLKVTSGTMSLNDDSIDGSRGSVSPTGTTEYEVGNQFQPLIDDSLYAIEIVIGSGANVTSFYEVVLYEAQYIPSAIPSFTEIYRSMGTSVLFNDINNLKSFVLDSPKFLTAGSTYFACIHSYIDFEYAISGTNPIVETTPIAQSVIGHPFLTSPNVNEFFSITETPIIQLNFNPPCNNNSSFTTIDNGNNNYSFTNTSTGNVTSYLWDFGDGNTSTLANPSHTYLNDSTYTICLTVNDGNSCTSTYCDSLIICGITSSFNYIDNGNGNYTFNNTSTGNISTTFWNFGDGTTSNSSNSNHTFLANGTFVVQLISFDSNSLCIDYEIVTLQITGVTAPVPCNASFIIVPDSAANNDVIIYNTSTGNGLTYVWSFGDGNISTSAFPASTYTTAGPFQLCLTVNDGNGCGSTYCDSISSGGLVFKTGGFNISVQGPIATSIENEQESFTELNIYPNPFKDGLTIDLNLIEQTQTEIFILDIIGNRVAQISNEILNAGEHKLNWQATNIANGVYLLNIKTANALQVKKLILNR